MCRISLNIGNGYAAFAPVSDRYNSFIYRKRELPKRIKKILKVVKRAKGEILSVKSHYGNNGQWVKTFVIQ